jgi:hypothetical protein
VEEFIRRCLAEKPDGTLALGLCNAGHFTLTKIFAAESRVSFFIDYGLYRANSRASAFFASRVPRLLFCFPWVESPEAKAVYGDFRPPLFTGRGLRKEGGRGIRQGKKRFVLKTVRVAGAWLEILILQP